MKYEKAIDNLASSVFRKEKFLQKMETRDQSLKSHYFVDVDGRSIPAMKAKKTDLVTKKA
jgi:hypothetical protein